MSGQWEEPEVIATFGRSFGEKEERLQLERGQYNGRPTWALRVCWKAQDGSWRWAAQKPTESGKAWQKLNLKGRELHALGEALIKAAADAGDETPRQEQRQQRRLAKPPSYDGPPAGAVYAGPGHDDGDIPF